MVLSAEQIKYGFWYWRPDLAWPPDAISSLVELNSSQKVNLCITQLSISSSKQKELVKKWCNTFPKLENIKYVWFNSKVTQDIFDAACEIPNLEGLYIKWSSITNLNSFSRCSYLKHIWIGESPKIESIDPLTNLKKLVTLELERLDKISDFNELYSLKSLEGLGINGSMYNAQNILTLSGIEQLEKLSYLTVYNTKIQDNTFAPLLKLQNLIRFNSSWNYPESEFLKLKLIPSLKYGNIETDWKSIAPK